MIDGPSGGDEARRLAGEALESLHAGAPLSRVIPKAASVAALRGHVAERAWLQFQLADLEGVAAPGHPSGKPIPSDFFKLRREIDGAVSDATTRKRVFENAKNEYLNSRESSQHPGETWHAPIAALEELLEKMQVLVDNATEGRAVAPNVRQARESLREVYAQISARVASYLELASA